MPTGLKLRHLWHTCHRPRGLQPLHKSLATVPKRALHDTSRGQRVRCHVTAEACLQAAASMALV
eukprot:CAMPEP_0172891728 /NCGR_PEP_ID=MMETSP1075-20121228/144528_1 /TAXON_ID=2916 /ORGANISM="Ceratium fusus, Strain PA161109" /LENGTH=63 /DNA_ID=CAMNT_0013746233 /DNA_START=14 /DNA_END=205 /DNA_ORIENTATION=-